MYNIENSMVRDFQDEYEKHLNEDINEYEQGIEHEDEIEGEGK